MPIKTRHLRGDTLVEVMFSIGIFALIAVISINLMNNGVSTAQTTLEISMARNEIDAQAEALRFVHNSHVAEKELNSSNQQFQELWEKIVEDALDPSIELANSFNQINTCEDIYKYDEDPFKKYFVLNPRLMQPNLSAKITTSGSYYNIGNYTNLINDFMIIKGASPSRQLKAASLYPRILYDSAGGGAASGVDVLQEESFDIKISAAEGIWVIAVKGEGQDIPEFYDFYIRTCWYAPGRKAPSTIGTIVRLYNPKRAN